jgi:hypothetical protein
VTASFLEYQSLDTSLLLGAAIQATLEARHISLPPSIELPREALTIRDGKNSLQVPESLIHPRLIFLQVPD